MKAILYAETDVVAAIVQSFKDNRGYYDSPAGFRKKDEEFEGISILEFAPWANRNNRWESPAVYLGFTPGPNGAGCWIRCYGTWVVALPDQGIVVVGGRRHSIRELLPENPQRVFRGWKYLETQRDDLAPWEVAT